MARCHKKYNLTYVCIGILLLSFELESKGKVNGLSFELKPGAAPRQGTNANRNALCASGLPYLEPSR